MTSLIQTEAELDDVLSVPNEEDIAFFSKLEGDLVIVGVGGKIGPGLAQRAGRAVQAAGAKVRVVGTAVHCQNLDADRMTAAGVKILSVNLLEPSDFAKLPDAGNVIFMAGRKFGSTGQEGLTWAMNVYVPALIAERYRSSRIVAFSSGNVYPFLPVMTGGATEETAPAPVGDYAQSVLGRERMFEYFSVRYRTPVTLLRLNYAVELRYGVLVDIASKVFQGRAVDVAAGAANVIWQGDVNSIALRSLGYCQSPPFILNLTGPETLSIRAIARRFGEIFGKEPILEGEEAPTALLNNAARCFRLFGYPSVSVEQTIEWVAHWIKSGGSNLGKPTHFETRNGKF